jgi:hypothetical protein
LPTIKSRCRHFLLTPPAAETTLFWLKHKKLTTLSVNSTTMGMYLYLQSTAN